MCGERDEDVLDHLQWRHNGITLYVQYIYSKCLSISSVEMGVKGREGGRVFNHTQNFHFKSSSLHTEVEFMKFDFVFLSLSFSLCLPRHIMLGALNST